MPLLLSVHLGNIVRQPDCDGIVNSANRNLRAGSGVCGAIHRAAGPALEAFSHKLAPLETGDAVATPGFLLGNRVIIHTKGPRYDFDPDPATYLARAMRNTLLVADQNNVTRLAVPALSMGIYGYPPEEAVPILVQAALETEAELDCVQEIRFVVTDELIGHLFDSQIAQAGREHSGREADTTRTPTVVGDVITAALIAAIRTRYRLAWTGIHGVQHWSRVRRVGLQLAAKTGARADVVELFAFLHDSCRESDRRDPDHGLRAVAFVRDLRGTIIQLDDEGFSLLCVAMEHHSKGSLDADITVQTCWDADRIDLTRLGIKPDPDRLCTDAARQAISR